jgi:hypothetical protein
MKRFEFRLSRVKDLRQRQMEAEQETLRKLLAELEAVRQAQQRLREEYLAEESALAAAPRLEDFQALASWRRSLGQHQARLESRAMEISKRIDQQRLRAVEASRRYRLLEKLYEQRRKEWEAETNREVEAFAAEVFLAVWGRNG